MSLFCHGFVTGFDIFFYLSQENGDGVLMMLEGLYDFLTFAVAKLFLPFVLLIFLSSTLQNWNLKLNKVCLILYYKNIPNSNSY